MRFDDSLATVLNADTSTPFGAQTVWRQLVDLIGRRRAPADAAAIARLSELRAEVPPPVRAAAARSLVFARPPAALVRLFADDALNIAVPVLRSATLTDEEWFALLPTLNPSARSVLRHRRDLTPGVLRALESFGPADLVLPPGEGIEFPVVEQFPVPESDVTSTSDLLSGERSFTADWPNIAEPPQRAGGTYPIADLVARIDAYQRQRANGETVSPARQPAASFRFETDVAGTIRWVEGIAREALIGLSLALGTHGAAQLDCVAAGGFQQRSAFDSARLVIAGEGNSAGDWLLSGVPVFESLSGRFAGFRGTGRRTVRGNQKRRVNSNSGGDALRQLVHELRTPANAINGFAEMIDEQLLGPVTEPYRDHAATIRQLAGRLIAAIEDLDVAARLESRALPLHPEPVQLGPVIGYALAEVDPIAAERGAWFAVDGRVERLVVQADARAVERVVTRLASVVAASATAGEALRVSSGTDAGMVQLIFARPRALADVDDANLFAAGDEPLSERGSASLLGTGFALRLVRRLATELKGNLAFGPDRLTLQLPAAEFPAMEQVAPQA